MADSLISQPIDTLEELLGWLPGDNIRRRIPFLKLKDRNRENLNFPRTLVCHDMMNGYSDDKYDQGCSNFDAFNFWQWKDIDIFVYFSHHFITIPTFVYRVASHLNQVPILGTFILEGKEKLDLLKTILSHDISCQVINKLVLLAQEYQFDGWLLNIETQLDPLYVSRLISFIKSLKESMEKQVKNGIVIWYDSVNHDGRLIYQNCLNQNNFIYFKNSHAFFTNYDWTCNDIMTCKKYSQADRLFDVYVGIDLFDREKIPPTRFLDKCVERLKCVRHFDMSVALFAIGYIYENFNIKESSEKFASFWDRLKPYMTEHPITVYPFKTNFCSGKGLGYYLLGNKVNGLAFSNLSIQQIQANFRKIIDGTKTQLNGIDEVCSRISYDTSYIGGSCHQLTLEISASNNESCLGFLKYNLFTFNCDIRNSFVVNFTYLLSNNNCKLSVALELEFDGSDQRLILLKDNSFAEQSLKNVSDHYSEECVLSLCSDQYISSRFQGGLDFNNQWVNLYSIIHEDLIPHGNLKAINLILIPDKNETLSLIDVWFGQLSIFPYQFLEVDLDITIIDDIRVTDTKIINTNKVTTLTTLINYHLINSQDLGIESIDIFLCYDRNQPETGIYVGKSLMIGSYFLEVNYEDVKSYSSIFILLQTVLTSGFRIPLSLCPGIDLDIRL